MGGGNSSWELWGGVGGGIEHKVGLEGAAAENGGPESLRQVQPFLGRKHHSLQRAGFIACFLASVSFPVKY